VVDLPPTGTGWDGGRSAPDRVRRWSICSGPGETVVDLLGTGW